MRTPKYFRSRLFTTILILLSLLIISLLLLFILQNRQQQEDQAQVRQRSQHATVNATIKKAGMKAATLSDTKDTVDSVEAEDALDMRVISEVLAEDVQVQLDENQKVNTVDVSAIASSKEINVGVSENSSVISENGTPVRQSRKRARPSKDNSPHLTLLQLVPEIDPSETVLDSSIKPLRSSLIKLHDPPKSDSQDSKQSTSSKSPPDSPRPVSPKRVRFAEQEDVRWFNRKKPAIDIGIEVDCTVTTSINTDSSMATSTSNNTPTTVETESETVS